MAAAAVIVLLPGAAYAAAIASDTTTGEQAVARVTAPIAPKDLESLFVEGTGRPVEVSKELAQDAERYSSQTDETLTPEMAGMQNEFAGAATEIELAHPDLFVHAMIVDDDDSQADFLIQLTARPTEDVIATLSKLSGDTEVRFGGTAPNIDAQTAASGAALRALGEFSESLQPSGAGLNEARSGIRATYSLRAEIGADELEVIHAAVTKAAREASGLSDLQVELEEVREELLQPTANVVGGRELWRGGEPDCSAGFTAVRNGQRGLLTAAHCGNAQDYRNVAGIIQFVAHATPEPDGDMIDLQFHRTLSPHATLPQFQWRAANEIRTVTSKMNPVANQTVCLNAMHARYACAKVTTDTNVCRPMVWPSTGNQVNVCRLVRADRTVDVVGDSGGPWFNGGTAFGVHLGHLSTGSHFTRIGAVEARLGANLLLG